MRGVALRLVLGAVIGLCAGCSLLPGTASPAGPVPAAPAVADGGAPAEASCAIDAGDLSAATGMTWEHRATLTDHPLETMESVLATACIYTADRFDEFGDPLTLRVDTVEGSDAAAVRDQFAQTCAGAGGTVVPSTAADGAVVCDRDGSVQEGNVTSGDTSVDVYYPSVDRSLQGEITSSFEQVLGTVRM